MFPIKDFNLGEMKHLVNFTYTCADNSILQNFVLAGLFSRVQQRVPTKVLPNQITIFGLVAMLVGAACTFLFDRSLSSPPPFLVLVNLLCLVLFFVADGVDGIHARRTDRSSTLGYLLDHGVDSCACMCITLGLSSTFRIGFSTTMVLLLLNIYTMFFFGAVQHKYTGVFAFNYVSGCSEGLVFVMLMHAASFFTPLFSRAIRGELVLFAVPLKQSYVHAILICSLAYAWAELLTVVLHKLQKERYGGFFHSLYSIAIFFCVLLSCFVSAAADSRAACWSLVFISMLNFSLCYVEEALSLVLQRSPDSNVFFSAYLALAMFHLSLSAKGYMYALRYVAMGFSFGLFVLRTGSIIRNYCAKTGTRFLLF
ncbi:ethanolaminephosphotransferase [Pancytospora philotis]|nr:ethanolaminephosphotransferase [Pancytospora philotis]